MAVNFTTGANFAEGQALLSRTIQEIINTTESQVGLMDQMAVLGFVNEDIVLVDGVITSMVGPEPLEEIAEDGVSTIATLMEGFNKRYKLKEYSLKHKCTKVLSKWLEKGPNFDGVDSSVKTELLKFRDNLTNLVYGNVLIRNQIMQDVFARGFSVTEAYGPGSALGDGQALISATHVIKKPFVGGPTTFDNTATGALSATTLESTIEKYKTSIYAPNGYRIKTPDVFTLMVPRALETTARKILNSSGPQAGIYAGTANNANLLNVFSFQGSKVKLVVLDMLGEYRKDGTRIGNDAMWFLANTEYNLMYRSFRVFSLWDKEVETWKDDETSAMMTKIGTYFTADAFNAEGLMGWAGA